MYTIGQVSELYHLPVSTLRYYDKEGLFPHLEKVSGIRKFSDAEMEALHVIECLKKSGFQIKVSTQFMQWCTEGPSTYGKRKQLFETRKEVLEQEMKELEKNMAMVKFKCWYYKRALADGSEDAVKAMIPDNLPEDIQALYNLAHGVEK